MLPAISWYHLLCLLLYEEHMKFHHFTLTCLNDYRFCMRSALIFIVVVAGNTVASQLQDLQVTLFSVFYQHL